MKKSIISFILFFLLISLFSCSGEKTIVGLNDLRVISSPDNEYITLVFSREKELHADESIHVSLIQPNNKKIRYIDPEWTFDNGEFTLNLHLYRQILWSPDDPALYRLKLKIEDKASNTFYTGTSRFGIRSIETRNGKFFLNGLPMYVRAYGGEGGCGCDDLSREAIRKRLTQAKNYGFNTVRHHSHIPQDSYMDIADEVGLLVQMETGGKKIGDDVHSERFAEWRKIWIDMVKMGRQHPATFIYGCGNEMYFNTPGLVEVLDSLYDLAKELDPGTPVLNRSGSNPFNDDHGKFDLIERPIGEYEHTAEFASEAFEAYLRGERKGKSDEYPIIAHEYPLVASYPNPELISKYDSIPPWIDTMIVKAKENGLEHMFRDYVRNTEAIQAQVRKEMLEEARKFPELDGYSMLRFTDCGAYVSGVVDDFADPKNVSAEEFLRTNGETVLLCSWDERVLTNSDTLRLILHCSHHGGLPFRSGGGEWEIARGREGEEERWRSGEAETWRGGVISEFDIPAVDVKDVVKIELPLHELKKAQKLTLRAWAYIGKEKIKNEWDFWVFPEVTELETENTVIWDPNERLEKLSDFIPDAAYYNEIKDLNPSIEELILTDSWDESFYDHLNEGGRIWILSGKTWAWPEEMGIFGLHITRIDPAYQAPPIFPQLDEPLTNWLTICSNHPKRYGNSGTVIFDHPALKNFPHDGYCDMQFWPMIYRAKSLHLKFFPDGMQPMIQAIDNFYRGEHKGYLVEMKVGKGSLLISTLNLVQHLDWSASTRYMTSELFNYMKSEELQAKVQIKVDDLKLMIDLNADEVAKNPPRVHSEMAARYETLWERRLSEGEVIILYPYEAEEAIPEEMDIHYEYAQTQWYYKASAGKTLSWSFENDVAGNFNLHLNIAGVFPSNKIMVELDGTEVRSSKPECSGSWQKFVETVTPIENLKPGEHVLRVTIPESNLDENDVAFLIRDMQLKEVITQ